MAESSSSALEEFRQQWQNEVDARNKRNQKRPSHPASPQKVRRSSEARPERPINKPPMYQSNIDGQGGTIQNIEEDLDQTESPELVSKLGNLKIGRPDDAALSAQGPSSEPRTALEHYERAVEKESQGSLGDSLLHYRRAYRLDAKVDQTYKNKHFPTKSKVTNVNPSDEAVTVPSPAHHSSKEPSGPLTISELIESFADAPFLGAPPIIEGDRPPSCAIQKLPTEVLLELLSVVALRDPALLVKLSLVCKRLAYHVATDNTMWKEVALGPEFGLASQKYTFATDLQGRETIFRQVDDDENEELLPPVTESFFPKDASWREVFHAYPRIRFSGVYISTVNYTRPGGASATQSVWSNPIHIVTYYRYLRFFRDGTCVSLLTTSEPIEVVHILTPENLTLVRSNRKDPMHPLNFTSSALAHHTNTKDGSSTSAPASVQSIMKHALRGRWRLCHPSLNSHTKSIPENNSPTMSFGDVHIETEGAGPRYMYTMHLSLNSTSRSKNGTKNNKLQWKGFWSYNSLTQDWAEFHLRHDKPFYFSRVRSYGLGY